MTKIQQWLDDEEVNEDLGGNMGIWHDVTTAKRNANVLANCIECALKSMELQEILSRELNE